jgi:hypothetical protein
MRASDRAGRVDVVVPPALTRRNRLTCAFRPLLAIPHAILVGAPVALVASSGGTNGPRLHWGASGGLFGVVAFVVAVLAWFAIVFGAGYPDGLWNLAALYMRWRVRAFAYMALLRDEYPPFGDGSYPAELVLERPTGPRNVLTVAFRLILVIPHAIAIWLLSIMWVIVTIIMWLSILFTASCPEKLYRFSVGVLRWSTRVEVYLLLLRDEYPPFSLD